MLLPGAEVYPALEKGIIDAADWTDPAANYDLGFAAVPKYIVMGPVSTPCLHQPVDLMELTVNIAKWTALPKDVQAMVVVATRQHSWDRYACIQKEKTAAWDSSRPRGFRSSGWLTPTSRSSDGTRSRCGSKEGHAGHGSVRIAARVHERSTSDTSRTRCWWTSMERRSSRSEQPRLDPDVAVRSPGASGGGRGCRSRWTRKC